MVPQVGVGSFIFPLTLNVHNMHLKQSKASMSMAEILVWTCAPPHVGMGGQFYDSIL